MSDLNQRHPRHKRELSPHASILMLAAIVVAVLAIQFGMFRSAASAAQDGGNPVFTHWKDLRLDPKDAYGQYVWSPDSKSIALTSVVAGGIRFINVLTGETRDARVATLLPTAITWSQDGAKVAISYVFGLDWGFTVLRASDLTTVDKVQLQMGSERSARFGDSLAFSPDGSKLLVDEARPDLSGDLLYAFDLETNQYRTVWKSPFGTRQVMIDGLANRFALIGGKLFYAPKMDRVDEIKLPPHETNRAFGTQPSSCFATEVGQTGNVTGATRLDFPPSGMPDPLDGSADVVNCLYMPAQGLFEVARTVPLYEVQHTGGYDVPSAASSGTFYEAVKTDTGHEIGRLGPGLSVLGDLSPDIFAVSPTDPYAVSTTFKSNSDQHVVMWDVLTGQMIASVPISGIYRNPQFSPDGRYLAIETSDRIVIFSIRKAGK